MKRIFALLLTIVAVGFFSCTPTEKKVSLVYPQTKKVDTVDVYFGQQVADPYRWLEADSTKATADWVASQNEVTFSYLKNITFRDAVRKRLDEVQNYERLGAPRREGEYYYYSKNSGLQNHNVQYRKKGENGTEELFLDPNTFSADGTTALAGMFFSKDGSLITILIQEGGSDWRKAVTMNASDKSIIGDTLVDLKFTGISWQGNDGFYYARYDNPKGNQLFSKVNYNKVCYHKLNSKQSTDKVVFDGGAYTPQRRGGAYLTEDEKYMVVSASVSTSGNELYLKDLT
ncbi:MAG: S9 family peptidase, partial [Cyclobacteriaceae bacterium]|nr:S9 family peptidase [Cyclobacteriaceae bacterium]